MTTLLDDPVRSTWIFGALLVVALLAGARRRAASGEIFPRSTTEELKGFAILAVFFAHVGYFLIDDGRFLFPLSAVSGVGVDLFLLLAGYGLTASALATPRSAASFYRRHLPKLYAPMWASLAAFFLADYLSRGVTWGPGYVAQSFAGYFPTADLAADVNSPLWYFTFIVGCYLLFPLLFSARRPWATAAAYAALGYALVVENPEALSGVIDLYAKHYLAFPLGIGLASLLRPGETAERALLALRGRAAGSWVSAAALAGVLGAAVYLSGVGTAHEQLESLALALLVTLAFLSKPVKLPLLGIFGAYSYDIYLLHWPIVSRYAPLYALLPGWLATILFLALFVGIGRAARRLSFSTRTR